jgi:hypothetical protein
MDYQTCIINVSELSETDKNNMLLLHRQYFDNVFEDIFMRDLSEKNWIILMRDSEGQIYGFSTMQLIWLKLETTDILFLFSGDTIINEKIRNSPGLAAAFFHFAYKLIENYSGIPIYWFLISKGYRTYRYLPLYFNEYYPVHNKAVPQNYQRLLDAIAFFKFGSQYIPESHLIRFKTEKDRLKPEHATISGGRLKNPVIKFFLDKNPFFYEGEELTCITAINHNNFNSLVERTMKSTIVHFNLQWS